MGGRLGVPEGLGFESPSAVQIMGVEVEVEVDLEAEEAEVPSINTMEWEEGVPA